MSTEQILSLLISERDKLSRAIEALGEQPVNRSGTVTTPVDGQRHAKPIAPPKRRTFTPAQRRRQAEKMKAFWAAKRKSEGQPEKPAKAVTQPAATAQKRHPMTAAQKKSLSLKMKAAWVRRKKQGKA